MLKKLPWFPILLLLAFVLAAVFAPYLAPHDPMQGDLMISQMPPAWVPGGEPAYPLGTDEQGRDVLSILLFGLRVSLAVGFAAVLLSVAIGTPLGLLAGYAGGRLGELIMRLADIQLAVPTFLVALVVLALTGGGSVLKLILVIGVVGWANYARLVRGAVLSEKEREYVLAAEALGMSRGRIMFRHILPNVLSVILVQMSVDVPRVILLEATLSFLGVGVSIETPAIGLMIQRGLDYIYSGVWWTTVLPGLVLATLVLATNLIGDWMRDAFDPRRRAT
ncbi:ABC transporter permease [Oceanithermus desulfurans]|uniref:ABC transporter permease n=2 Tax=Oceanithermus desulfurans TaxID=227924 RepID=A0A511RP29_9DEIN|nr:ABC transporter permease [Oceanithermus desulfurans]MBB6029947.1 peptide/nickel transport system permease protein [Oceanithermus desulfurans]GEM90692.1 ABC transporter permease [Oceanithermus desulfurans NBRC 100063]